MTDIEKEVVQAVRKQGQSSLAVTIPKPLADAYDLQEGDILRMKINEVLDKSNTDESKKVMR